jgi:hypothetical protein
MQRSHRRDSQEIVRRIMPNAPMTARSAHRHGADLGN